MRDIISLMEAADTAAILDKPEIQETIVEQTPLMAEYHSFVESHTFTFEDHLDEGRIGAMAATALIFTGITMGACTWANNAMSSGIRVPPISSNLYGDTPSPVAATTATAAPPPVAIAAVKREDKISQLPAEFRQDWAYMTVTLWGEARSESDAGVRAVGNVILNRVSARLRGHDVRSVVTSRRQFSCWNSRDPNREQMLRMFQADRRLTALLETDPEGYEKYKAELEENPQWESWERVKKIAYDLLSGDRQDNTGGADHYHTGAVTPVWNAEMTPTTTIGAHRFFKS